jgi:hypothetical protein
LTIAKGVHVLLKLEYDGMNRLLVIGSLTMLLSNTPTPTVLEEMHHLNRLPDCIPILEALRIELPQYQTIAQEEVQKPEISRKGKWGRVCCS